MATLETFCFKKMDGCKIVLPLIVESGSMKLFSVLKSKIKINWLLKEYDKTRMMDHPSMFCYAPSIALRFALNGNAYSCCYNRLYSLGKYPQNSIAEIWFGDKRKSLEKSVNNFQLNEVGCHSCYSSLMSKSFGLVGARNYDLNDVEIKSRYPQIIDFELDNICNLQCIMCNGENSSTIRTKLECEPNYQLKYDDLFVKQLEEFIPHLKVTRFSGGEPFLSEICFDIWNKIIELNPKCKIYIQSNGTVFNDKIMELFTKGNVNVSFSIDSIVESTYASIRIGANFKTVMSNFDLFLELSKKFNREIGVSFCLLKQNAVEFSDYLSFFNQKNVRITVHKVVFPIQQSVAILSVDQLEQILKNLAVNKPKIQTDLEKLNDTAYNGIIAHIDSIIQQKKANDYKKDFNSENTIIAEIWLKIEHQLIEINQIEHYNIVKQNFEVFIEKINNSDQKDAYLVLLSQVPISFLLPEFITNSPDRVFSRIFIHEKQR